MVEYIRKQILTFQNDISSIESTASYRGIDAILDDIKNRIKVNTSSYFETVDSELKNELKEKLARDYSLIYYYQAKKNGIARVYLLDYDLEQLPNVYLIEQGPERFKIDEELLKGIAAGEGLTMAQALELLKWTVNNTRDNLSIEERQRTLAPDDVYGNSSLEGACGLSQFSSLYPLQQMGFDVTVNNIGDVSNARHAYGTVVFPIKSDGKIVNKRFLLDCTYRQFFTLPYNVVARYLTGAPFAGFFVNQDKEEIEFAKELLKNGFVEASLENMEKYFKPFFAETIPIENVSKIDEEFSKIDIIGVLENKQIEFDYTDEEFTNWGFNLSLPSKKEKAL